MSEFLPGDLIYHSKPFVHVLASEFRGERCDYCLQKSSCLKRCSQCLFLYFCSKTCQKKSWNLHQLECQHLKKATQSNFPTAFVRYMANIIFKLQKNTEESCDVIHGHQMTFRRLMSHVNEIEKDVESSKQLTMALALLTEFIGVNNLPSKAGIVEIFGKLVINTFSILDGEMQSIGCGLYLGPSILDHSCEPNADIIFNGIELNVRAIKRIPHRDISKVYISYIDLILLREERQKLLDRYFFTCQCPRCTSPYYENLLTKTLANEEDSHIQINKFKDELERLNNMKKNKVSASIIRESCLDILEKQENVLADTHIYRVKVLEICFDACIDSNQWADAISIGNKLTEPYKTLYDNQIYPSLGIHYFKLGKIQNLQGLAESAVKNLLQAEDILKKTHGADHPLYHDLQEVLSECYN